ncbi:MAG TPA: hypothetical protein VHK68_01260, partial [Gemmatimonadales bacterium]|nr:hypothetical protein [Gemmatimonadales bacterium]
RKRGRGTGTSLFGVAALSIFLDSLSAEHSAELLNEHWGRVKDRMRPSLEEQFIANLQKAGPTGADAERLNGDLAGLIAFARFAKARGEADTTEAALRSIDRLARLRIDLERTNPQLLAPATSATKRLHHFKLARFDHLARDVSALFTAEERALAAARLKEFREARPGWWMAFGDRFVGGENYISPPHLSHAMFAGAALVEGIDAATLSEWIDVPWCEADLFFIEKCALALTGK